MKPPRKMSAIPDHNLLLKVQNLRKSYPNGYEAVKGLDFNIRRGEIFGFLGPNGAGKTTTISMLSGLQPPTSGQIIFDGLDTRSKRNLKQVKRQIGLVPQELALYPTLSAYDNLTFFGRIYSLSGKKLKQRVQSTLEMVGLADRAGDAVKTFSGGMKRRINIAAALLHEPQILFLDEPTVGVDPQSRNAIFESIEQLNRDGMTILYTTHYMEEAQRLCDRVAIIDNGQIVACDTTSALIRSIMALPIWLIRRNRTQMTQIFMIDADQKFFLLATDYERLHFNLVSCKKFDW